MMIGKASPQISAVMQCADRVLYCTFEIANLCDNCLLTIISYCIVTNANFSSLLQFACSDNDTIPFVTGTRYYNASARHCSPFGVANY